jgi:hypothetical protein
MGRTRRSTKSFGKIKDIIPNEVVLRSRISPRLPPRRVATLVARATPPQEVFAAVAEEVGRLLAVDFAILVRYDPQDMLEVVGSWIRTGAPAPAPVGGRNVTTLVSATASRRSAARST